MQPCMPETHRAHAWRRLISAIAQQMDQHRSPFCYERQVALHSLRHVQVERSGWGFPRRTALQAQCNMHKPCWQGQTNMNSHLATESEGLLAAPPSPDQTLLS